MRKIYRCVNDECKCCTFENKVPCVLCGDIVKEISPDELMPQDYMDLFSEMQAVSDNGEIKEQDMLEILTAWAETGDAEGQLILAGYYQDKDPSEENIRKAFYLACQAADQQYPDALASLGIMYLFGAGTESDDGKAKACFDAAIERGSEPGKMFLALYYLKRREILMAYQLLSEITEAPMKDSAAYFLGTITEDYGDFETKQKCVDSYGKSARGGYPHGMYELARQYDLGLYVPRDEELAILWYDRAVENGVQEALAPLIELLYYNEDNKDEKLLLLKDLCDLADVGDLEAALAAGIIYKEGVGVPRNLKKAYKYFEIAASSGNEEGILALAAMLAAGHGTGKDIERAKKLMENFEEDNPEALYIRGLIAEEEDDVESAVQYYTEAAEMYSHPDASYHLGKIFLKQDNEESAICAFKEAAILGHKKAKRALCEYYEKIGEKETANMYRRWISSE